jgi:hypothetical protein
MRNTPVPVMSAVSSGWRPQVVDLVRLDQFQGGDERGQVLQVTAQQFELGDLLLDRGRLRVGLPAQQSVDAVAPADQELGQVPAVLAGDARDQCPTHGDLPDRVRRG